MGMSCNPNPRLAGSDHVVVGTVDVPDISEARSLDDALGDDAPNAEEKSQILAIRVRRATRSPWVQIARDGFTEKPPDRIDTTSDNSLPLIFHSPPAYRLQVRAVSSARWHPKVLDITLQRSFLYLMSHDPRCPPMNMALDAAAHVYLGQTEGDARILQAGQKMYCSAVALLRMDLAKPLTKRPAGLIGAIHVLQIIEGMSSMSLPHIDWRNHAKGASAVVQDRQSEDTTTPGYTHLLECNFRSFHFWDALLSKKRIGLFLQEDSDKLLLIAQAVPGVLEDVDELDISSPKQFISRALRIHAEVHRIEAELGQWADAWSRGLQEAPYRLAPSTNFSFPKLDPAVRPSQAFHLVLQFRSLQDAINSTISSACLLCIKRARLQLNRAMSRDAAMVSIAEMENVQKLKAATTSCADTLCMGLPFLGETEDHGLWGVSSCAPPLALATAWYRSLRRQGDISVSEKVLWCHDASKFIRAQGCRR